MATIDQYKIKIEVDGKEEVVDLNKSIDKLQGSLTKFSAAGIAAFTALGASAIRMADEMSDLADATGISVGKIYQLSAALQASGSQFDNGGKLLQQFSNTLTDVENGSTKAINALNQLGLSKQQIENLSDEQLFQAAVNGLGKMEAGFERTRIATELFGKAAMGIDWAKLAAGTNQAVDPALEKRLKDAGDALDNLQSIFRDLQLTVLQAIGPIIQKIKDMHITAEQLREGVRLLGAAISGAFALSVVIQIAKTVYELKKLYQAARAAGAAAAFLEGLTGVGLAAVAASAAAATAAYVALGKAMEDTANIEQPAGVATPSTTGAPVRTVGTKPEEKVLASMKAQTAEIDAQNAAALRYQKILNGTIGMDEELANIKKLDAQLEIDRANNREKYEKQIAVLKADNTKESQAQVIELDKQMHLMDAQLVKMYDLKKEELERLQINQKIRDQLAQQAAIAKIKVDQQEEDVRAALMQQVINGEITEEQMKDTLDLQKIKDKATKEAIDLESQLKSATSQAERDRISDRIANLKMETDLAIKEKEREIQERQALEDSAAAGAKKAVEENRKQYSKYNVALNSTNSIIKNLENSMDQFAQSGKLSFGELARSIIADLTAIALKAALTPIFSKIGTGIGSFVGSIFGLAEGGTANKNQPYIVGEKGPELFVPKSAGSIIPNDKMNSNIGATSNSGRNLNAPITNNYITNNINAVDAKSVAQLFAENRKTLLGSVKMAEKELPYMA